MDIATPVASLGYLIIVSAHCFILLTALFIYEKKKYPLRTCKSCGYSDNISVAVVDGEPICHNCRHKH